MMKTVLKIKDEVNYQNNAIVSKTIVKEEKGNITLFSFYKDEALSEHTAPFDAVVNIIDGEAEIKISGEIFLLKEGEMIIMPANEPHALRAITNFKMILTMIKK